MKKLVILIAVLCMLTGLAVPAFAEDARTSLSAGLLAELEENALNGDAQAQYQLGYYYDYGDGKDYSQAHYWYSLAAEQNYAKAFPCMAFLYRYGQGVEADEALAESYFEKAVEFGFLELSEEELGADGLYHAAVLYCEGLGVDADIQKAMNLFLEADSRGCPYSAGYLADIYYYTYGSKEEAFPWYLKAAQSGDVYSMLFTGIFYDYGWGCEEDDAQAVYWFEKAASEGSADAMFRMAEIFYYGGDSVEHDSAKALALYENAVELGSAGASARLASLYRDGAAGLEKNPEKALELFTYAAESGVEWSFGALGDMYYKGLGTEKDYEKAVEWYRKGAEVNFAESLEKLGRMYYFGYGVERDYEKAAECLSGLSDRYTEASYLMGLMYRDGHGVEKDVEQAISCFLSVEAYANSPYRADAQCELGKIFENEFAAVDEALEWYNKAANNGSGEAYKLFVNLYNRLQMQ